MSVGKLHMRQRDIACPVFLNRLCIFGVLYLKILQCVITIVIPSILIICSGINRFLLRLHSSGATIENNKDICR